MVVLMVSVMEHVTVNLSVETLGCRSASVTVSKLVADLESNSDVELVSLKAWTLEQWMAGKLAFYLELLLGWTAASLTVLLTGDEKVVVMGEQWGSTVVVSLVSLLVELWGYK